VVNTYSSTTPAVRGVPAAVMPAKQ
jgi:hypothetical protein